MADLSYLWEIDAKLDALDKGIGRLEQLEHELARVTGASDKTEQAMHKLNRASHDAAGAHDRHSSSVVNLGHQFEYAKNGLNEFAEAIGLVLVYEAVEKIIDKVKELGAEILNTGADAQRARQSFAFAFGDEPGNELIEYIDKIGSFTEFRRKELKGYVSDLARAGFGAEEIPRALAASMDIAARDVHDKAGGMMNAIMALGMLKTTGRIEGRGFRRLGLGEANAPEKFYEELSRRTGQGVAQLKKEMEKGKIPVNEAIESLYTIIAGSRGKLGTAAVKMGEGMAARITHFKEVPELLFESVEKSPAFGKFASFIGRMADQMGPEGPLGEKLAAGLGHGFDKITEALEKLTPKDIEGFIDALAALPPLIVKITQALAALVPYASKVAGFLGDFGKEGTVAGRLLEVGKGAISPFLTAGKIGKSIIGGEVEFIRKGFSTIAGGAGGGLVEGLKGMAGKVEDAARTMVKGAPDAARDVLRIHSPSIVFEEMGALSAEGFARGLDGGADRIEEAARRAVALPDSMRPGTFAVPAPGGGAQVQISMPININVSAHGHGGGAPSADEIGEAVAARVEAVLPAQLESVFEKLLLQAGG